MGFDKNDTKDKAKFLRAQGDHLNYKKQFNAEKAQIEKLNKECTFAPKTNKKKIIKTLDNSNVDRTSIGSINLEFAKRKDELEFAGESKYDQLYALRKRQVDKTDKAKEDYEYERHGQECTFAPKLLTKSNNVQPRGLSSSNNAGSSANFAQQ